LVQKYGQQGDLPLLLLLTPLQHLYRLPSATGQFHFLQERQSNRQQCFAVIGLRF
jgi:hypothetical protein